MRMHAYACVDAYHLDVCMTNPKIRVLDGMKLCLLKMFATKNDQAGTCSFRSVMTEYSWAASISARLIRALSPDTEKRCVAGRSSARSSSTPVSSTTTRDESWGGERGHDGAGEAVLATFRVYCVGGRERRGRRAPSAVTGLYCTIMYERSGSLVVSQALLFEPHPLTPFCPQNHCFGWNEFHLLPRAFLGNFDVFTKNFLMHLKGVLWTATL